MSYNNVSEEVGETLVDFHMKVACLHCGFSFGH
jgi:hypothetical protein